MLWLLACLALMLIVLTGIMVWLLYEQGQTLAKLQLAILPSREDGGRPETPVMPPGTIIALSDAEQAAREKSMLKTTQQWQGWAKGVAPNPPPARRPELLR